MGWKVAGLLVEGAAEAGLLGGRPRDTGETVAMDDVLGGAVDYAVGRVGGWTVVLDQQFRGVFDDEVVAGFSAGGRVLMFITNSVMSVHGFAWFVEGQLVRRVMYSEGELMDEVGERLPEEERLDTPLWEDDVFEIISELTGLAWGDADEAEYRRWTCTE